MMKECPLCNIKLEKESVWYADSKIIVLNAKGSDEKKPRIICAYKEHSRKLSKDEQEHALEKLRVVAMRVFSYTDKFQICPGTYRQIQDHWHVFAIEANHGSGGCEGGEHVTYSSKTGRRVVDAN